MKDLELTAKKRSLFNIEVGAFVQNYDGVHRVESVIDFRQVLLVSLQSGKQSIGDIDDLMPVEIVDSGSSSSIEEIDDDGWRVAKTRYEAIKPIINAASRKEVEQRSKEVGVNTATLYRWIKRYSNTLSVEALMPEKTGWVTGKSRINREVDAVIDDVIENYYLTVQRASIRNTYLEIKRVCEEKGLVAPSQSTVRNRVKKIPDQIKLARRGSKELAQKLFRPVPGTFPDIGFPLSVVQVDHTPLDVIIVDDEHRLPVGRPWLSLALDLYTRVITGFYISLDPPSSTSVGLCLVNSVCPKERQLATHGIKSDWPVWGMPVTIHVDNGADFRSLAFQKACELNNINIEYRPVGGSWLGGHVERVLGTISKAIHHLPGTTFSSIHERGEYDSDGKAVLTYSELELWLTTYVTKVYHNAIHSELSCTPLQKWTSAVFGDGVEPGYGLPSKPSSEDRLLLDFLPGFDRIVQPSGVSIDGIRYYDESLRYWIGRVDPAEPRRKLKLTFKRDPRNISQVWFFDTETKSYFKVPYADQSLPPMSAWELARVKSRLRDQGDRDFSESQIASALAELRRIVDSSSKKSRQARRLKQRQSQHEKVTANSEEFKKQMDSKLAPLQSGLLTDDLDGLAGFGDIDES